MRIVRRSELLECPIGTVFIEYTNLIGKEILTGGLRILTNASKEGEPFMVREVCLLPSLQCTDEGKSERKAHWVSHDATDDVYEYLKDDRFVVFSKSEILKMVKLLVWALIGCEAPEDMDVDFLTNEFNPSSVVTPQED